MQCPQCKRLTSTVINSRPVNKMIKRRRKCAKCGHTWLTVEMTYIDFEHAFKGKQNDANRLPVN